MRVRVRVCVVCRVSCVVCRVSCVVCRVSCAWVLSYALPCTGAAEKGSISTLDTPAFAQKLRDSGEVFFSFCILSKKPAAALAESKLVVVCLRCFFFCCI